MKDCGITVGLIKDRFPIRLTGRIYLAPRHLQLLMGVALDHRNTHPDHRNALGRIPLFDLISQRLACS